MRTPGDYAVGIGLIVLSVSFIAGIFYVEYLPRAGGDTASVEDPPSTSEVSGSQLEDCEQSALRLAPVEESIDPHYVTMPKEPPLWPGLLEHELWQQCDEELRKAESTIDVLSNMLKELQNQNWQLLQANPYAANPTTPRGALVQAMELHTQHDHITLSERITLRTWVDKFPVCLSPEEVDWLLERVRMEDWEHHHSFGASAAVIAFLGEDRLLREMPQSAKDELLEDWGVELYNQLFGL